MRLTTVILVCTAAFIFLGTTYALDDDEAMGNQQFQVQFFQFNPKDLAISGLGGRPRRKEHSKRSNTDTPPPKAQNTTVVNATAPVASNSSAANATTPVSVTPVSNATVAAAPAENATVSTASDTDIMNTLINRAMIKKNTTDSQNTTVADAVKVEATNTTSSSNDTTSSNTTVAKESIPSVKPSKKSVIPANVAGKPRKNVLNPNPKPSEQDAMLNIKQPKQLEGKPHDANIHAENTTKVTETENKHTVTENAVTMEKNNNTVPETDNSTQNATTNTEEEKEKQRLAKLEKDKQTNREIKEKAKEIKPIENTVGNISNNIKNIIKDDHQNGRSKVDRADPGKIKHRNNVAKFVPLYKTSAKDHRLSFQIGSMKHPKHNIHPKCHACPYNSTYKECVKKSTLLECNQGLENICFTKSSKKNGVITYQMGCADHNKCVNAKAFPCKDDTLSCFTCCQFDRCNSSPHFGEYELDDLNLAELAREIKEEENLVEYENGREHCFTCCQYDRCNSSPHHGDFELDELNLQELSDNIVASDNKDTTKLDSSSSTDSISGSWFITYLSSFLVFMALNL